MKFLRSLFGLNGSSNKRTVLGKSDRVDISQVAYIKESIENLHALHELYKRYKGSPHEGRIKRVWEKTKEIHAYLVARNRLHELALFHIQHTEHFISAFTAIINLHQQRHEGTFIAPPSKPAPTNLFEKFSQEKQKRKTGTAAGPEMVIPLSRLKSALHVEDLKAEAPMLTLPEITLNTYTKIPYRMPEPGELTAEIGYTSTPQEKETFLLYVSAQLGISDITYVGNALVTIPNSNGGNPTGIVPVIFWEGFLYAINLNDFRLFPVKTYRKSF